MPGILDGLTQPQARAAALRGPVLVLAGSGTGKTRTPDRRRCAQDCTRRDPVGTHPSCHLHQQGRRGNAGSHPRAALGDQAAPRSDRHLPRPRRAPAFRSEPEVAGLRPGFDFLDADDTRGEPSSG